MQRLLITRCLSTSPQAVSKDLLMRLRKSTGYTFQNCKKAIEIYGDDEVSAVKWLHEEARKAGWAKMATHKKAANGLIGVIVEREKNLGLMIELNCETDFVARNDKFRTLASQICSEILRNELNESSSKHVKKWNVNIEKANDFKPVNSADSEKLSDLIAFNVGQLGEKIILTRAMCLTGSSDTSLFGYVHPKAATHNGVLLGHFGAIVNIGKGNSLNKVEDDEINIDSVGSMLCQHIVGMNPLSVGSPSEKDVNSKSEEPSKVKVVDNPTQESEESDENVAVTSLSSDKELLKQDFLLHPEIKVAEFIEINNVKILDFCRFECGES